MVRGRFWAIFDLLKIFDFWLQMSFIYLQILFKEAQKALWAKYSNKLGVSKMVQNRPNPWTIVHGFWSILTHFRPSPNLLFLALNELETSPISLQRSSKRIFCKMQQEKRCFQNGPKSTKSMDYSPWFLVNFGPY